MNLFYQKNFLKLLDFTPAEISDLLALAAKLKADTHSSNKAVIALMLFSFSGGQGGEKVFAV